MLAYKEKRHIINHSYQTQADNIVGKMTMAALDREMLGKEVVPSGPTRLEPIFPAQRYELPSVQLHQPINRSILAFNVNAPSNNALPPLPPGTTINPNTLEVPLHQVGLFRVHNGVGKELVCNNSWVATIAPVDLPPNAHTLIRVKITTNPQDIRVFSRGVGQTSISVVSSSRFNFDPSMTVIVPAEVTVFFHFLDGPNGIKTVRKEADLDAILKTMNDVYQRNHAGFTFVKRGVNPALRVPGLGGQVPAVRVHGHGGPDFDAIGKNEKPDILFDIFFVGSLADLSDPAKIEMNNLLAITTRPPDDSKPLRCCICRDAQASDPAGIDPGKTLAHEAGHALGEDDDQGNTDSLMFFKQSGQTDTRINAAMAQRMLSSFKSFPP